MKSLLLAVGLVVLVPGVSPAGPMGHAHYGDLPGREPVERQDECQLKYYNFCSLWTWTWDGYCWASWPGPDDPPAMYGTCFDLSDCPGHCRHLDDVWWAVKSWYMRGTADIEIYCADANSCPIGGPLAGIYGFHPYIYSPWQHFDFGSLPLCECDEVAGKFIVMITDYSALTATAPYSDLNHMNIDVGCEADWRCTGHSFVYRNRTSYCDVYGEPGPLWWRLCSDCGCTNYPSVPPGCHNILYDTGFFCEWLIDCYLSCQGPTKAEEETWSGVKSLYR